MINLLHNDSTATLREVKTHLCWLHLHELGDVDDDGHQQGWDDVGQGSVVLCLHLPVVVGSAYSQISLNTNTDYQIDAGTH